jgi:hypothetical protein
MASGKRLEAAILSVIGVWNVPSVAQHHVEIGTVIKGDDIQLAISIEIPGSDSHG